MRVLHHRSMLAVLVACGFVAAQSTPVFAESRTAAPEEPSIHSEGVPKDAPATASVRLFRSASSSMAPTLLSDDVFLVDIAAYRTAGPKRGDVVVFKVPRQGNIFYVKRLVGLPGDTVQMIGGVLHLNGKPVGMTPASGPETEAIGGAKPLRETLPNGVSYTVLNIRDGFFLDDTDKVAIPAGHYFVLGDNRDNSTDSRLADRFGFVAAGDLYGQARRIVWSSRIARIAKPVR